MGFTYRKSVNLCPFRVNLSKSGLGYSVVGLEYFLPAVDLDKGDLTYTIAFGMMNIVSDQKGSVRCHIIRDCSCTFQKRQKKKPWRYRWPDEVRDEVLARLLTLNATRHAEEVAAGMKAAKKMKPKKSEEDFQLE